MKKSSVIACHMWFKERREDIHHDEKSWQPKTQRINVSSVQSVVSSNRRLSMLAKCDKEKVRQILTKDLEIRKSSSKMVRRILTEEKKKWAINLTHQI